MKQILSMIKNIRENKNISQRKMGELLNMSYGTYRDIEKGKIRLSLENYLLICKVLDINPLNLLTNENYIILSNKDINEIDNMINTLQKIKKQILNNEKPENIKIENSFNNSTNTNINIGNKNK